MNEYPKFTPEMKKTHTILIPSMLPIHFKMVYDILISEGYKVELLKSDGQSIIDEGLKNVHNDTCYPALLVIGQMIDALKSGNYDPNTTALFITQTGGGCRASNYIYLLRKALKQSSFSQVPVISINFSGLEKNPGFKLTTKMIIKIIFAMIYGDMLMWISNQVMPYELHEGDTEAIINIWCEELCEQFHSPKFLRVTHNYRELLHDFAEISVSTEPKIRVGIVGEIYMKYAPLGNNNLEKFLMSEGAEPVLSPVLDFFLYCLRNSTIDNKLYGINAKGQLSCKIGISYIERMQGKMKRAIDTQGRFKSPTPFSIMEDLGKPYISKGVKMGEGWLLTSEMIELLESGVDNIVCTQPFGCLPNHIIAKGMMRKIKASYPKANIVAVDYDPSASPINQENRLKLMLSNAKLSKKFMKEDTK
ncbi:MAG: 2-hydroxyacyl-CoA dehydratase [Erysipelotrichaceae bacterium]